MADSSPGQGPSRDPSRPRAQSEATRSRPNDEQQGNLLSQTWSLGADRRTSSAQTPGQGSGQGQGLGLSTESSGLRSRRSRSNRVPSIASRTTLARRTQGNFTLAGPDDTSALRQAHEPFVHPSYADLNPEYEQPNNAKPVWSLAKPLPRVVRPGMVPTKDEVLQNRMGEKPSVPAAENSQKLGMEDVDPNELEAGRIGKSADPRKMMAGVDDARAQRENNFVNKLLTGETGTGTTAAGGSRMSRTSSMRRQSSAAAPGDQLSAVPERESQSVSPERRQDLSDEHLHPVPEEHEHEHEHDPGQEYDHDNDINDHLNHFNESAYPEDLHPLVQDLVEDEVHNNHTVWSVIRTHHREALAESLGVFVQLSIGLSADLSVALPATTNPNTAAWAWGLGTMMAIYVSGGVSGAHLNPSISSMLWFYRGFPKRKLPEYFAAQFIGAFVAALAVYGLYYQSINEYLSTSSSSTSATATATATATANIMNSFVTNQRSPWITSATAFFNEFFGTVLLSITVLALGDDQNAPPGAGMSALVVGLTVYTLCITFSYQTGAAFNPSRDFGPRLALLAMGYGGDLFLNPYWFYGPWAGSLCGAFIGGFLYDFMIFTGGESPVNYPLERTKRAMRRKKVKWKRRLRLEKKVDKIAV